MKTHVLHGKIVEAIEITKSHQTWQLARDGRFVGADIGFFASEDLEDTTIIIDGSIKGGDETGVRNDSDGGHVVVGVTGHINVEGDASYGVVAGPGTDTSVVNNGTIDGGTGVYLFGTDVSLVNNAHGTIRGATYGVVLEGIETAHAKIVNHGLIAGDPEAAGLILSGEKDSIVNDGRIIGTVLLNSGNDVIDTRGGTIKGLIRGGFGDDTLITDNARISLTEERASGNDTVKSTVSYKLIANVENLFLLGHKNLNGLGEAGNNQIHGNGGDNLLRGFAGNDKLFGGNGDDRLVGGADGDFFEFSTGWDHDCIVDFEQGLDLIDVSKWEGIDDFTEVFQHAHDSKLGVVIVLGHDSLTIEGVTRAELVGGDFMF